MLYSKKKAKGLSPDGETRARRSRYPAETITGPDYADYIALLSSTPTQAESLLHNLEQAAQVIGFHVNIDKIENMCFNQEIDISTKNGGSLKLVYKFAYFVIRISSTEGDINMSLGKYELLSIGSRSHRSWPIR